MITEREYQKARAAIAGVTLARIAAVALGVWFALGGQWTGTGIMLAMVAVLHFALPVVPQGDDIPPRDKS